MPESFDAYYKWFGIPPKDQPPNHYRLLGLELFESDPDVIESAADRQMAHLRSFQAGPHTAQSQNLLNEVAAAKLCLLDQAEREVYNASLRPNLRPPAEPRAARPAPVPSPVTFIAQPRPAAARPIWQEPIVILASTVGLFLGAAVVAVLLVRQMSGLPDTLSGEVVVMAPAESEPNQGETARNLAPAVAPDFTTSPNPPPAPGANSVVSSLSPHSSIPPPQSTQAANSEPQVDLAGASREAAGPSTTADDPPELLYERIGSAIDLLAAIDLKRDVVNGEWRADGRALVSPDQVLWARVMIPYAVPDEYVLTVVIERPRERLGGRDNFNLGLVAPDGRQFMYCITAFGNGGLFLLDGKEWHVNETSYRDRGVLKPGENVITCSVRRDGIQAQVNDRTLID